MGLIYEPVKHWKIIYEYRLYNKLYTESFTTISQLRLFFTQFPERGALVGYGNKFGTTEQAINTSDGQLSFEWTDQVGITGKRFTDVWEFVEFLKEYPVLAKCVEYVPK